MAFSKWFWDDFPRLCTKLWWVFMVVLLVVTAFWREPVYAWFAALPWLLLFFGFIILLTLVHLGNYIPGVPGMLLPLLVGWSLAESPELGMIPFAILFGLFIAVIALGGSQEIKGRARRDANLLLSWNLHKSDRFHVALGAVRTIPNVIFKSRIGKFAAYCGHINIAAGIEKYNDLQFFKQAFFGHFLWALQYIAIGFLIGWLVPYVGKLFS